MRLAFNLAILAASLSYTWIAFTDLDLLTANGRLGPGFFPRAIGVALVVAVLYNLIADRRAGLNAAEADTPNARDILVFVVLSLAFVAMLDLVGGLVAMIVYMLVALSIFNPGRHLSNVLVSVLLPFGVFLMFDTWLNANLPQGPIPLPLWLR
ncbi:MAG TPA: tripartite tricarboxylate transporter TctB family protein [Trueperaceae bacterium]